MIIKLIHSKFMFTARVQVSFFLLSFPIKNKHNESYSEQVSHLCSSSRKLDLTLQLWLDFYFTFSHTPPTSLHKCETELDHILYVMRSHDGQVEKK